MYQPRSPLIEMVPQLRVRRLGELELGRLLLLGDAADGFATAGLALRADALSRGGDITEGVVRLGGGAVRFERHTLDANVVAVEIDYVLEPDLASGALRAPAPGDLVASSGGGAPGVLVSGPWQGPGLLDVASAVARAYPQGRDGARTLTLGWQLVQAAQRARVLFRHLPSESPAPERYADAPYPTQREHDARRYPRGDED